MTTIIQGLFNINGVVSTDKSVMQNVNMLANAVGCWVTYDIAVGKWSVVINRAGSSVASFNDGNIIGGINITGTGVSELYNAVTIQFPHKDLRDQTDYIDFELDSALRFPNELDNVLNISIDLINDPIQAEYIAVSELKQGRIDKVITFRTDYTNLGLKAGDLIDVTNSHYGYTSKVFRITKMEEDDAEGLVIAITALEYDADVYSTAGLTRKIREKKTGIIPKDANEGLTASDKIAGLPTIDAWQVNALVITANNVLTTYNLGQTKQLPFTGRYKVVYNINWGSNVNPSPPMGSAKKSQLIIYKNGVEITSMGEFVGTGDEHVQIYEDHIVTGFFSAVAGDTISYLFGAQSNFSPASYTVPAGFPAYTVPAGALVAVWISGDLQFVGI